MGGGNGSTLGTITFNVPDDAKELPYDFINSDVGCIYHKTDNAIPVNEAKNNILTQASNPAGYFYFLKVGDIYVADRIVAIGTSYDELNSAGYIDGDFRVLSKSEYELIFRAGVGYYDFYNQQGGGWPLSEEEAHTWHTMFYDYYDGSYNRFYGEISSTLNESDKVWIFYGMGASGDWEVEGDFYYTQKAVAWNDTNIRNYLFGGDGFWYMLGSYRPACRAGIIEGFDGSKILSTFKFLNQQN